MGTYWGMLCFRALGVTSLRLSERCTVNIKIPSMIKMWCYKISDVLVPFQYGRYIHAKWRFSFITSVVTGCFVPSALPTLALCASPKTEQGSKVPKANIYYILPTLYNLLYAHTHKHNGMNVDGGMQRETSPYAGTRNYPMKGINSLPCFQLGRCEVLWR